MSRPSVLSFGYRGVSSGRSALVLDALERDGFEILHHEVPFEKRLKLLRFSLAILTAARADIVFLRFPYFPWLTKCAVLLKRRLEARLVVDAMVSAYDTNVLDRRLCAPDSPAAMKCRREDATISENADLLVVDTQTHGEYLAAECGWNMRKMVVVPLGSPSCEMSEAMAPKLTSETRDFQVLYLGSYVPLHGIETMIQGIRMAASHLPSARFDFYGRGQDYDLARRVAEGIPNIHFYDSVPPAIAAELARNADIIMGIFGTSTKARSVVPYKIFDALAIGRPAITMRSPAAFEMLRHGEDSWLVEPTAEGIADGILHLAQHPELRAKMAEGARAAYLNRFHSSVTIKPLVARIEALCANNDRAGIIDRSR